METGDWGGGTIERLQMRPGGRLTYQCGSDVETGAGLAGHLDTSTVQVNISILYCTYIVVHYSVIQCSAVHYSAAVYYNAVQ